MKKALLVLPIVLASTTLAIRSAEAGSGQSWTIKDTVEYEYFIEAQESKISGFDPVMKAKPVLSPDGSRFFVVKVGADLEENFATYDLLVFDVAQITRALMVDSAATPTPVAAHRVNSRNLPGQQYLGVMQATWSDDSRFVTFMQVAEDGVRQLFRLDTQGNTSSALTQLPHGVTSFSDFGDVLFFSAVDSRRQLRRSEVQAKPLYYLRDEEWRSFFERVVLSYRSYVKKKDGSIQALGDPSVGGGWASVFQSFYPSPDKSQVVITKGLSDGVREKQWSQWPRQDVLAANGSTFFIADTETGSQKQLLDAPTGVIVENYSQPVALWRSNRHVILTNTMLPLEDKRGSLDKSYIVEYDTQAGRYTVLDEMPDIRFAKVKWLKDGVQFALYDEKKPELGVVYSRRGNQWKKSSLEAPIDVGRKVQFQSGLAVEIKVDDRGRQRLEASLAGKTIELHPLNARFSNYRDSAAKGVEWTDRTGAAWKGKLFMPPNHVAGTRLPLIVEPVPDRAAGWFSPEVQPFIPGMPNQPLAAEGFAVLQLDVSNDRVKLETPAELPAICDGYNSAIEKLVNEGVVDPSRIGVVGFSRTGLYSFNILLCDGKYKPAAGVTQDSYDASYYRHIFDIVTFGRDSVLSTDKLHGGAFWENREAWLERSPGFNLHKVDTPYLITDFYGPAGGDWLGGAIGSMERYAALRTRRVPVEVVQFHASHVLTNPVDRYEAMQLVRDWMQFWLNGIENDDPKYADRIRHWRKLRDEWQQSKS